MLLRSSISKNRLQKFAYMKMFYIFLAQSEYAQAENILKKCRAINPLDQETMYWSGMFEKHVNQNAAFGDSLLQNFYGLHEVGFYTKVLLGRQGIEGLNRCLAKYPYLKEVQKEMTLWAAKTENPPLLRKHLELYKLYGKLNLDTAFVREQETRLEH